MSTLLLVTGAVVWLLIAARLAFAIIKRPKVRALMISRPMLPYSMWATYRVKGFFLGLAKRLNPAIVPEVVAAHKSITVADMANLRDVMVEMDTLPTIERGKQAVGVSSLFDLRMKGMHRIPSPYTHPMQYPPMLIPGVPAHTFYDSHEFEWARVLEESYPIIKHELMQVLAEDAAGFKGYMSEHQRRLGGWNTFNFWFYGKKFEENCARCPETTRILESLPRFEKDHIMFSALNPHARIPPHTGPMNGILRAHLGLVVPNGCYVRVGPDERTWQEGKVLVFDDSFEHEVYNHSDAVRIVLFMNFWHPCLSDREIEVLERFRAAYERSPFALVHAQNQAAKRAHDLEVKRVAPAAA
jgi:aspartyl/asparaginyl beta-hydroxylase (cupin superfamily)